MLSSILNSPTAVQVNIRIMRVFIRMRELLQTHKDIFAKLEKLERNDLEQESKIMLIFEYLKQFEEAKQQQLEHAQRKRIGFKTEESGS